MTPKTRTVTICFACAVAATGLMAVAGDLNPPVGPVARTHKTLTEVEPRIAINATNTPGDADSVFRIAVSGSYYLSSNVAGVAGKKGIEIAADNVSLDLRGFALIGGAGSLDAIQAPAGQSNIIIRDGTISLWGGGGVVLDNCRSMKFNGLTIYNVGTSGVNIGYNSVITGCTIDAVGNTGPGILVGCCCVISNCHVESGGDGISVGQGCDIIDCIVNNCGDDGIVANSSGNRIERCVSDFNNGDGIEVASGNAVIDCTAHVNSAAGIHATSTDNRIEGNQLTSNTRGIDVDGTGNIIVRNTCSGNVANNWDVVAGNVILVVNATTAAAVSGNSGGTAPGSTDPNANFSY